MNPLPIEGLLVNPRATDEFAALMESAWAKHSKMHPELFAGAIGISTSGSTSGGVGSIIVLSRLALETSAAAVNRHLRATARDVWGLALPLFHVGGFSIPVRASLSQSRVASFDEAWNARVFCDWLAKEQVTLLSLVPTQLFDLVALKLAAPKALRAIVVGGGRLDESLHAKALELGWPVLQSYGLTECCSQVATAEVGSDGRRLEVLDHVEARVGIGQKLWLRSKSLLSARLVFDLALRSSLERPVDHEGWFETSDRASIERLGFSDGLRDALQVLGREGESVKVLGELVDLVRVRAKIEDAAQANERLAVFRNRTWVVAIPNARTEHELVLMYEAAPGEEAARLSELEAAKLWRAELKDALAPFEIPTRAIFLTEFPRSPLGKVLSSLLTEEARKRSSN